MTWIYSPPFRVFGAGEEGKHLLQTMCSEVEGDKILFHPLLLGKRMKENSFIDIAPGTFLLVGQGSGGDKSSWMLDERGRWYRVGGREEF